MKVITDSLHKHIIKLAHNYGRKASNEGKKNLPTEDPGLMNLLLMYNDYAYDLANSWSDGWKSEGEVSE
jgi:hypothetical protein